MQDTTPGLSPRAATLLNLWQVSEQLSQRIDKTLGSLHGVSYVEFMVLLHLASSPAGHLRRVDLAVALGRSASGITRLLKPMEKIGLVSRAEAGRDARVSLVKLSEAGWEKLDHALPTIEELSRHLTQAVGDSQLDSMGEALRSLKH